MASRKKKTTQKFKQTRASKNESSMVNTNEPLRTPLMYATDTAAQPSIEQAMSNDSSSASITQGLGNAQASTTGASSFRAGAPATGAAAIKPSQKAVAQTQCPLFLLPTEVRLMIYKHVFDHETIMTGAVNKNTFTRIYTIGQPQDPLALLKTCRSIHAEVKELVNPRSIVRDISATTVVRHVYGDSWEQSVLLDHVDLLRKMTKLWVRMGIQRSLTCKRFKPINPDINEPLRLEFVDEEELDGASGVANRGWPWLLEAFVATKQGQ
ncbi:hypothetical protein KCU67_g9462, partial [Aureobasidium melanogenum]